MLARKIGKKCGACRKIDDSVGALHPIGNIVSVVQKWNLKLLSYDMDHI
jgi:hypothetical protein